VSSGMWVVAVMGLLWVNGQPAVRGKGT
jgi:hypothetical protein